MSETPPETPTQAARVLIGWFAGGLAFQSVETFASGSGWLSLGYGIAAVVVAIGDYKLKWLLSQSPRLTKTVNVVATDARWWVGIGLVSLLMISLSPFIEQKRLPFLARLEATQANDVVARKDYELLGDKLAAMTTERDDLKQRAERADQKIAIIQQEIQDTKSQIADLDKLNEKLNNSHNDMVENLRKQLDIVSHERDQLNQQLAATQSQLQAAHLRGGLAACAAKIVVAQRPGDRRRERSCSRDGLALGFTHHTSPLPEHWRC